MTSVDLKHYATPVIFLTPHAEEIAEELRGTRLEADDYVASPFSAKEMVERVKVVLDRSAG